MYDYIPKEMKGIEKITSRDNKRLKQVRQIRDGRETSQIFIEGRRLAEEAIRSGIALRDCFVAEGFGHVELLHDASLTATPISELSEQLFRTISDTITSSATACGLHR